MTYLITSFLTVVDELLDEATIQEVGIAGRCRQIRSAVSAYSGDNPDVFVEDESGDGGKFYEMVGASGLLAQWVEGFSRVLTIEYPAITIASDGTPQYLGISDYNDDYRLDVSGTQTRYLEFLNASPAATETWRIGYTTRYKWTASTTTTGTVTQADHGLSVDDYIYNSGTTDAPVYLEAVDTGLASHQVATVPDGDTFTAYVLQTTTPAGDFDAITYKAACLICTAISTKYSRIGDSMVSADSGAHTTKATEFSNRARTFCGMYDDLMGLSSGDGDTPPDKAAGVFVPLTTPPAYRNRRSLYHRR